VDAPQHCLETTATTRARHTRTRRTSTKMSLTSMVYAVLLLLFVAAFTLSGTVCAQNFDCMRYSSKDQQFTCIGNAACLLCIRSIPQPSGGPVVSYGCENRPTGGCEAVNKTQTCSRCTGGYTCGQSVVTCPAAVWPSTATRSREYSALASTLAVYAAWTVVMAIYGVGV
jgi:hypothetical protein